MDGLIVRYKNLSVNSILGATATGQSNNGRVQVLHKVQPGCCLLSACAKSTQVSLKCAQRQAPPCYWHPKSETATLWTSCLPGAGQVAAVI